MSAPAPSRTPWVECPTLRLDGRLKPAERLSVVPREAVDTGRRLLQSISRNVPPRVRLLAHLVRVRTANRFHAEIRAVARIAGADWRDVMIANISYDLVLSVFGCSTVALPTPSGPVLARNMDWWPEDLLAQASWLVRTEVDGRMRFVNAGWPGAVGVVSGLSGRGFAVVLNAVSGPEGVSRLGYPVLLHLRRVVEDAGGFTEALRMLARPRLAAPCLLTLVGRENDERVVIERSPRRSALRWGEPDRPLIATNDYRALFRTESREGDVLFGTTCRRYDALCRFFAQHRADRDIPDEELLYVLSDPQVIQGITAQHVVFRPRAEAARMFVPRRLASA